LLVSRSYLTLSFEVVGANADYGKWSRNRSVPLSTGIKMPSCSVHPLPIDKRAMYTDSVAMTSLENDGPLKMYLRELDTIQPLTKDEESDLLRHVRSQDAQAESACRRLIEANLSLVVVIAERHSSSGIHLLDLIVEGNLGLMLAIKTFPENSSDAFATHAATCIESAVSKAIAKSHSARE
jgi:DNA-directed RNA polymerase sigma subunit (sigma70/sigma32)